MCHRISLKLEDEFLQTDSLMDNMYYIVRQTIFSYPFSPFRSLSLFNYKMVSICNNVFIIGLQSVGNAHVSYMVETVESLLRSNLYYVPYHVYFLDHLDCNWNVARSIAIFKCFLLSQFQIWVAMFLSNNVSSLVVHVIFIISVESQRLCVIQ